MKNKTLGLTDEYAMIDEFGIASYVDGLSEYVMQCTTPMTVSIQGDWGTGKTSIMHQVEDSLKKRHDNAIKTMWFNTWQYSQFDMGDKLATSILLELTDCLGDTKEASELKSKLISLGGLTAKLMKGVLKDVTGMHLKSGLNDQLWKIIAAAFTGNEDLSANPAKEVVDLKARFQAAIIKALEEEKKDKMVVFIDDLDRLKPEKAVEFLEILKLFLDCKKCVFILAIDYAVVVRGVKAKYGKDFDDRKGRAFFDKIIQVPFSVPVERYDISSYLSKCLEEIGESQIPSNYIEIYEKLIAVSVGKNPRTIKRIFNAFMLIRIIADDAVRDDEDKKILLFAMLCLQNKFESAYSTLMARVSSIDSNMLKGLAAGDKDVMTDEYLSPEYDKDDLVGFFNEFYELLQNIEASDRGEELSPKAVKYLREVMSLSATTSSSEVNVETEDAFSPDDFIEVYGGAKEVQELTDVLVKKCTDCKISFNYDGIIKVEYKGTGILDIIVRREGKGQTYQLNVKQELLSNEKDAQKIIEEIGTLLERKEIDNYQNYIKIQRSLTAEKTYLLIRYAVENYQKLF